MATKIFISYRRDDAKYEARDIYKALRARGGGVSGTEWVIYWLGNSIIGSFAMVILFDGFNWSFQGRQANAGPSGFIVGVTLSLAAGGYLIWRWRNRHQK